MPRIMGRSHVCKIACILFTIYSAACTGKSPAAPTPQPGPPPTPATAAAIFLAPDSWDMPVGGGALEVIVRTAANTVGNAPAAHVTVALATSSGTLSASSVVTDGTGHARVTWSGTSSATITATANDVVGTSRIRVASPAPTPPPVPAPGPSPGPGPGPSPEPTPPASRLLVDIFASPRGGDATTPITFTARVLTNDGSPTGALTYAWNFGDGTTSTEASPTHLFRPADHWTVTLRVTSADGRTGGNQIDVVIGAAPGPPPPPAPVVTTTLSAAPASAAPGELVTFTATATPNSSAGAVTGYDWDFENDGMLDRTTASASTTHAYPTIGTKTAKVTARSANASGSATTSVVIAAPALRISDLTVSGTQTTGSPLTFTATVSAASGSVPPSMTFRWDYGNGSEVVTGSSPNSVTHSYNVARTYDVTVTVTAPDGRTATETIRVTIAP